MGKLCMTIKKGLTDNQIEDINLVGLPDNDDNELVEEDTEETEDDSE